MAKMPPIGIDDFERVIREDFYYVDKTDGTEKLLDDCGLVNFFIRPSHFGKSLTLSMWKNFFELGADKTLFDGLAIAKNTALCADHQGKYPVIFLSFKDAIGQSFEEAKSSITSVVASEAWRHSYLERSEKLSEQERKKIYHLMMNHGKPEESLTVLIDLLAKHHGQPVIVFADEYDILLQRAQSGDYEEQMLSLCKDFFSAVRQENKNIRFAVVAGCFCAGREEIFGGGKNIRVHEAASADAFAQSFGFTPAQAKQIAADYGFPDEVVTEECNRYPFGTDTVFCPWDVLNLCNRRMMLADETPQELWTEELMDELFF